MTDFQSGALFGFIVGGIIGGAIATTWLAGMIVTLMDMLLGYLHAVASEEEKSE